MPIINRTKLSGTSISEQHNKDFLDLLDRLLGQVYFIEIDDPTGSGSALEVTGRVRDANLVAPNAVFDLDFVVFGEAEKIDPSGNAVLGSATAGTIVSGDGTPVIQLRTELDGSFAFTLTNPMAESNWLVAAPSFGGPMMIGATKEIVTG